MIRRATILFILAFAAPASAQVFPYWLDANFAGGPSLQGAQHYITPADNSSILKISDYSELKVGKGVEVSGGVRGRSYGIGIRYARVNPRYDGVATEGVSIDDAGHVFRLANASTERLQRHDTALDFDVFFFPRMWSRHFEARGFGGVSYLRAEQTMFSDSTVLDASVIPPRIDSLRYATAAGNGVGFNVGGDVAYYFITHIGVTATLRFSKGTVTVLDPLTHRDGDLDVGGTTFGAGFRVRM